MSGKNIEVTADELAFIRTLEDFDLTMLLSEIHDHGWPTARKLIPMIWDANAIDVASASGFACPASDPLGPAAA